MPVHDSSHRVFLRRTYLLPYSSSIVAPVTYALIRIPNPAPPPRINDGISSNKPSAPQEASRNRATTATPTPIAVQPELILLLLEMNRVCLNCRALSTSVVRLVSSLNSCCGMRRRGGVSRLCGTRREYRALNSSSVCTPLRWLHGRHITWRLLGSLEPPLATGITWSMSKLETLRPYPQ